MTKAADGTSEQMVLLMTIAIVMGSASKMTEQQLGLDRTDDPALVVEEVSAARSGETAPATADD